MVSKTKEQMKSISLRSVLVAGATTTDDVWRLTDETVDGQHEVRDPHSV